MKQIKLELLGQAIGVVAQETYLVHDTIKANLRYGNPDHSVGEMVSAFGKWAIHSHMASLTEGYDSR